MDSNQPLYIQLKNEIIKTIENELQEHDKIASEHDLMEKYNMSRTTVRRALTELVDEGVLYSVQGVGTFVNSIKSTYEFGNYSSFTKRMAHQGYDVSYRLLDEKVIRANRTISKKLGINEKDNVFYLERVGIRDDLPVNYTTSYISEDLVPGIVDYDFESISLYEILENEYNIKITRTDRFIEAIKSGYHLADSLEINEDVPLLKFHGYVYGRVDDGKEELIEYFIAYYRTDITKFFIQEMV